MDWNDDQGDDEGGDTWQTEGEDDGDQMVRRDEDPTIKCPYCHRDIYDEAEQCPHCGQYICDADAPRSRKPMWMIIGFIICAYVIYRWIAGA